MYNIKLSEWTRIVLPLIKNFQIQNFVDVLYNEQVLYYLMKAYTCFKTHESMVLGLRERENWASVPLCSNCYFEERLFPRVTSFKSLLIDLSTNKIIANLVFTITPTIRCFIVTCYYNFEALLDQNYILLY